MISRKIYKPDREFTLVGGMIMNKEVLSAAYSRYRNGELSRKHFTKYFQPVFTWLIQYYARHNGAPGTAIQKVFNTRKHSLNKTTMDLVEEYLDALAENYRESDTEKDYITREILPDFIREREISQKLEKIQDKLDKEDYTGAESIISEFNPISDEEESEDLGTIIPFTKEDLKVGFDEKNKEQVAFRFRGDLDRLIGPLCKTWLVAITGTEKSGKSYLMNEIAFIAALEQRKKVLIINLELSEQLARQRNYRRISLTASKKSVGLDGKKITTPIIDCENNQFHTCKVLKRMPNKKPMFRNTEEIISYQNKNKWKICTKCRNQLDIRKNAAKTKRFIPAIWFEKSEKKIRITNKLRVKRALKDNKMLRLKNMRFRCFPRFSVTFDEVEQYIYRYIEKHKWHPDIIIFDYFDILAPEKGLKEYRHNIDSIWKKGAGLAGKLNCLVITADQAIKAARTQYRLDQMSTSESKTKDAHLDVRIGINQTDIEKNFEIIRSNVLFHRHEPFSIEREVIITQRLSTSQPILDSCFIPYGAKKKYRIEIE